MTLLNTEKIEIKRGVHRLRFPDFSIAVNDRVLLLGPSGCGKTSLLSMIAGLLPPTGGRIFWKGQDFYGLSGKGRDALRGRDFGFVFQTLHMLPVLTLRQNILMASAFAKLPRREDAADHLIHRLGLSDKADRKPAELSQGEQQRGAIARALLNRPALLVADEPTSALDDDNAKTVIELMMEQAGESGAALMVATHDARLVPYFDRIVTLEAA